VVVAEDGELAQPAAQSPEDRPDPVDRPVVVDEVAGAGDEVDLSPRRHVDDGLEEAAVGAGGEGEGRQVEGAQGGQGAPQGGAVGAARRSSPGAGAGTPRCRAASGTTRGDPGRSAPRARGCGPGRSPTPGPRRPAASSGAAGPPSPPAGRPPRPRRRAPRTPG